jgi:branched-subunit amino acid transport protein
MTTVGLIIIAALVLIALRFAALSLRALPGGKGALGVAFVPAALCAALVIVAAIGPRPAAEWLRLAPFAAGALVALLTRQLGYGVLAGLVVAAGVH